MDTYASGGVGAAIVLTLGVLYKVYISVNHKHIRSRCCGKEFDASLDIDESTPKKTEVEEPPKN